MIVVLIAFLVLIYIFVLFFVPPFTAVCFFDCALFDLLIQVLLNCWAVRFCYFVTRGFWVFGLLHSWALGFCDVWASGCLDFWTLGVLDLWSVGLLDFWTVGVLGCWILILLGLWPFQMFFDLGL